MTNPIDPISYNAGIEAAAKALREHEMKGRITVPWDRVPKSQKAKWLEKASIVAAALHRTEPQTAPALIPNDQETVDYVLRYGPRCRDCADENGVCPSSGLPCGNGGKAVRHVIAALNYGLKHGFLRPDEPAAPANAERLALDDGALLNRLKTEAQLAKNGGHPILERSFNLAIDEIKKLREAAKGQLVVVNVAIAERQRAERNRDMWKGQCERQAKELTALRAGGWREDMQS